ncbi:MAG TPA: N-acetyltransferase family protein [Eubacteriales bacterium]|nr:N-acetyltransferase family protein [Eubacteriales bacterium]
MSEISIRAMTAADWPDASRIYREGIETGLATFQSECPPWEDWDRAHLGACRLVAVLDGSIAGWAALSAVSGRCVYAGVAEVSVYIAKSVRHTGVGTRLLNALVSASEESGFWTLQSGILQENKASLRLHEKCGFRVVGYREKIGRDQNGNWRNTVLMERRSKRDDFSDTCGCACGHDEEKEPT